MVEFLNCLRYHLIAKVRKLFDTVANPLYPLQEGCRSDCTRLLLHISKHGVHAVHEGRKSFEYFRLIFLETELAEPLFSILRANPIQKCDGVSGGFCDVSRSRGSLKRATFFRQLDDEPSDTFDYAPDYGDQCHDEDDKKHPLPDILAFLGVVDKADGDSDDIAGCSNIAEERNHADYRINNDLRERGLFVEGAFDGSPGPGPNVRADRLKAPPG